MRIGIKSSEAYQSVSTGLRTPVGAVEDMGVNHIGLPNPATVMARAQGFAKLIGKFGLYAAGGSAGKRSPPFLAEVVRWVGMIFNGTFVPVIPYASKNL